MGRTAVCVTAMVLVAACGGGGGGATSDTIAPAVRDQLAADAAVVQAPDLGGSYTLAGSGSAPSADASESVSGAAAACFPTNDAKTALTVRKFVNGPEIRHTVVLGEVEAHADATSLTGKLTAFTPAAAASCMKQFIAQLFAGGGGVVGDVVVVPSKVDAGFDEQSGFLFTIPVSQSGDFTIGIEIVFGRVDRFRATTSVIAFDKTPDHSLVVAAMKAMANRLSQ